MPASAENFVPIGLMELRFVVDAGASAGSMTAFELLIPPQARVPGAHYHVEVDELFFVNEGAVTYTVDGERFEMQPGSRRFVPRGSVHHFVNESATVPARAFVVLTPGKIGPEFFRAAAEIVNAGGPPDMARMRDVMLAHGLVPA
jgi:mannose-6-phosphate isomerase-like protein (cupin superfamily)